MERAELARRLAVYVLTDRSLSHGRSEAEVVRGALAGGATAIQLRAKEMSGREVYRVGLELKKLAHRAGALFVVNDRLDLALAMDADGLHVGQDDLPAVVARRLWAPPRVLGVSAVNAQEARAAEAAGADYIGAGAVFYTSTKPEAGGGIGLAGLAEICLATRLPVVAIGGMHAGCAAEVLRAGACGLAVISAVVSAPDVREAAAGLAAAVEAARGGG